MRGHTSNELIYRAEVLAPDGATVLASGIPIGITDLTGRRTTETQLDASATQHMIVLRYADSIAGQLTNNGHFLCEEVLYIVDFIQDPRIPRPKMWLEVFCHVERSGN